MKKSTYNLIKWLFLSTYSFFIFYYIKNTIQPELHYHVQQPSFILDWDFLTTYLKYPGGISKYFTNFLMQFFIYKWVGPLVILAVGLLIILSSFFIIKALDKSEYFHFLMYIPFILLIALVNNYYFPFVVVIRILFVFLALWLLSYLLKKKFNYIISFSILALIISYVAGSGSILVFSITAIIIIPFNKYSLKMCLFFILFTVLSTFLIDFISYKYIFNIIPENTYFSFLLNIDVYTDAFMMYKPNILFYLFCYSMPILCLIILLKNKLLNNIKNKKSAFFTKIINKRAIVLNSMIIVIIIGVTYLLVNITFNKHQKNIVLSDYYCYNEKWKNAINVAVSDPQYDVFINYYYNRAIDNYGRYIDLFFNYPQYRTLTLYPPDNTDNLGLSTLISDYYFDLGYISLSQQWAYAAMSIMPYSPRVLKRLVITNLIYGNYKASQSFLNVLSKTLISKKFVNHYMSYIADTNLIANDKLIMEKRLSMPQNIVISDDLTERLMDLLEQNNQNKRAYDYLQMCYLLSYNLDYFMKSIAASYKFYNQIPKIFEQAILMYVFRKDIKNLSKVNVSKSSRETFIGFLKILNENNNNKELAKPMLNNYSNTYMYYITYYFPLILVDKTNKTKNY